MRRRAIALLTAAAMTLVAGCTSYTIEDEATPTTAPPAPLLAVDDDAEEIRAPLSVPSSTTSSTVPALPVPAPLPADPYADTPELTLGRLQIPRLGVDEPLQQGMTLTAINRGPSQWPGTAMPGQMGNMVIAGHRTTYSKPFHDLDLVEPGDEMIVETADGRFTYVAERTEIVDDEALWIADQSHGFTATTFACHPKGSARQRIVVFWQLVGDDGAPVPALA